MFADLKSASQFFENGCIGYSPRTHCDALDGMRLEVENWRVSAFDVEEIHSSWFADTKNFPEGSAIFDHALLMRDIKHEWHEIEKIGG